MMKDRSRARRNAITYNPHVLGGMPENKGAWHESKEEVAQGLQWGRRKGVLLRWVRRQMGERLTPRERRCIELYFFHDLTYEQVSGEEGCSVSSAHRAVRRALNKLRAAAREDGPPPWRRRGR